MQSINILFVCLGNICRSPMAEYLMREKSNWQAYKTAYAPTVQARQDGMMAKECTVALPTC